MDVEALKNWNRIKYQKVQRNHLAYAQTENFLTSELERLVAKYSEIPEEELQTKRLIRDLLEVCLRRFHEYSIKQQIGAHYRQEDLMETGVFEHLIPVKILMDLLLAGIMPIKHALFAPTVRLSSENDKRLRARGLVSTNDEPYYPFRRYRKADITCSFVRYGGETIEPDTWSIEHHYNWIFS